VVRPDGSFLVCDIRRGVINRVSPGQASKFVDLGGGPNGLALSPDGALIYTIRRPCRKMVACLVSYCHRIDCGTPRLEIFLPRICAQLTALPTQSSLQQSAKRAAFEVQGRATIQRPLFRNRRCSKYSHTSSLHGSSIDNSHDFVRNRMEVISAGTPSRIGNPFQSPVPLLTYSVMSSTLYLPETKP